jgi:hypothetical protein
MTQQTTKIFKAKCPKCGKEILSLNEAQFNYNYNLHLESHKEVKQNDN